MYIYDMICRHDEDLIDTYEFPSAFEQVKTSMKDGSTIEGTPAWAFNKKTVQTFKCKKCKRVRQITHKFAVLF